MLLDPFSRGAYLMSAHPPGHAVSYMCKHFSRAFGYRCLSAAWRRHLPRPSRYGETYVRRAEHLLWRKEDASFQVLTLESFRRQLKTLSARCCLASSFPLLFLFACGRGADMKRIDVGRCRMHDSKLSQKDRADARRSHSLLVAALSHSLPGPHPKPCPSPSPTLYPFVSPSPPPPLDMLAVERPKYRGVVEDGGEGGRCEQVRTLRIC